MSAIVDHRGNAFTRVGGDMPRPYEAGGQGRRMRGWMASGAGPNDAATGNAQTLRNRSRQQVNNNGYALSGINKLVSNIIGTGIKPRSMAEDKGFQRDAQQLWDEQCAVMDPEGLLGMYGQQAQACNTWLTAGECFIRRRPRRDADGLPVPFQLQVMEPELCPVFYTTTAANGNSIRNGIEYDAIGRRAAYYFYQSHPGDLSTTTSVDPMRLTRVPARDVIHLFDPVRPGQSRGVIKMAPILLRAYDVDKTDDAIVLRQQIANLFTAFVTNPASAGGAPLPNTLQDDDDGGDGGMEDLGMAPGLIQELLEGQDIRFPTPPSAGDTYGEFMRQQMLGLSAGMEVPFEILTGDFSKINDRTARVILNQFYRRIQQLQSHIVIHQMCLRVWAHWFMPAAVQYGALSAPGFADNPGRYTRSKHVPQAWAYINPLQDVQARRDEERAGYKTKSEIISETSGRDVDDVMAERAAENEQADRLGLVFDSDPRYTDNSGKRIDPVKLQEQERAEDNAESE